MSSDLCVFDDFSFSPFTDFPINFLQDPIFQVPEDKISNLEQFSPNKFENLTISSKPISQNHICFDTQFLDFSNFEVKTENFLTNPEEKISNLNQNSPTKTEKLSTSPKLNSQNNRVFDTHFSVFSNLVVKKQSFMQSFWPHSCGGADNVERFMQRSHSSSSFNGKPGFIFRSNFDSVMGNNNFENQTMCCSENSSGSLKMRRVCSTGDLQVTKARGTYGFDSSFIEEANFKVGRYSAEERKKRIHRYRAKRNQRNFNKTIKVDGYNKYIGEERTIFNILGPTQFQYYGLP